MRLCASPGRIRLLAFSRLLAEAGDRSVFGRSHDWLPIPFIFFHLTHLFTEPICLQMET